MGRALRTEPRGTADASGGAAGACQAPPAADRYGCAAGARDCLQRARSSVQGRCAQSQVGGGLYLPVDGRGLAVCGSGARSVQSQDRGLVDAGGDDRAAGD